MMAFKPYCDICGTWHFEGEPCHTVWCDIDQSDCFSPDCRTHGCMGNSVGKDNPEAAAKLIREQEGEMKRMSDQRAEMPSEEEIEDVIEKLCSEFAESIGACFNDERKYAFLAGARSAIKTVALPTQSKGGEINAENESLKEQIGKLYKVCNERDVLTNLNAEMLAALKELLAVAVPENTFTVVAIQHRLELARAIVCKAEAAQADHP